MSFGDKCQYWSQFFYMLKLQYHVCNEFVDKYVVRSGFNRLFKTCVFQHCTVVVCNHIFIVFVFILDFLFV